MGRKPLAAAARRTNAIKLLCTQEEFDAINAAARLKGYGELAVFCRQVLLGFVEGMQEDNYYLKLTRDEYAELMTAAQAANTTPTALVSKYAALVKARHVFNINGLKHIENLNDDELQRVYHDHIQAHTTADKKKIIQTKRHLREYIREKKLVLREMIRQAKAEPFPAPPSLDELC